MNLTMAKKLKSGDRLEHKRLKNADGTRQIFKVTSVKTWKTRPDEVRIGVKRGLYEFYKIEEYEIKDFVKMK